MSVGGSTGQAPAAPGSVQSGNSIQNQISQAATGLTPTAGSQLAQTTTEAPPGAAVSAYEYQQYVASARIILGPNLGAILGLPANAPVSGDQVLAAYYDLPSGKLKNLQELLFGANMYANSAGEPLTTRPVFGSRDIDSFNALSQLVLQAANTGLKTTADQIVQDSTNSGAGIAAQQNALSPVLGGGNTYQVNLTNPQDIYQTTNSVFQQELGRNPTQAEYAAVLKIVQQGQKQSQGAQIGQEESMSQQRYQQQIQSRTAVHTPAAATGNVPNGPFNSSADEAVAILQYGGYTVTPSNVAFLAAWIEQNGGVSNNPLAVSSVGDTGTAAQGIQAAVNLLHSPQYQAIDGVLVAGNASTGQSNKQVQQELSQWSGGAINGPLDTKAQIGAATDAVLANGGQQAQQPSGNAQTSTGLSGTNRQNMGLSPSQPSASMAAAASAPGAGGVTPATQTPGTTVPPGQVQPGQGLSSPGDNYLPASTIQDVQAASPQGAAFMEATTGANQTPYYANQAQAGLQAIINLIQQGPDKL